MEIFDRFIEHIETEAINKHGNSFSHSAAYGVITAQLAFLLIDLKYSHPAAYEMAINRLEKRIC